MLQNIIKFFLFCKYSKIFIDNFWTKEKKRSFEKMCRSRCFSIIAFLCIQVYKWLPTRVKVDIMFYKAFMEHHSSLGLFTPPGSWEKLHKCYWPNNRVLKCKAHFKIHYFKMCWKELFIILSACILCGAKEFRLIIIMMGLRLCQYRILK